MPTASSARGIDGRGREAHADLGRRCAPANMKVECVPGALEPGYARYASDPLEECRLVSLREVDALAAKNRHKGSWLRICHLTHDARYAADRSASTSVSRRRMWFASAHYYVGLLMTSNERSNDFPQVAEGLCCCGVQCIRTGLSLGPDVAVRGVSLRRGCGSSDQQSSARRSNPLRARGGLRCGPRPRGLRHPRIRHEPCPRSGMLPKRPRA